MIQWKSHHAESRAKTRNPAPPRLGFKEKRHKSLGAQTAPQPSARRKRGSPPLHRRRCELGEASSFRKQAGVAARQQGFGARRPSQDEGAAA